MTCCGSCIFLVSYPVTLVPPCRTCLTLTVLHFVNNCCYHLFFWFMLFKACLCYKKTLSTLLCCLKRNKSFFSSLSCNIFSSICRADISFVMAAWERKFHVTCCRQLFKIVSLGCNIYIFCFLVYLFYSFRFLQL